MIDSQKQLIKKIQKRIDKGEIPESTYKYIGGFINGRCSIDHINHPPGICPVCGAKLHLMERV